MCTPKLPRVQLELFIQIQNVTDIIKGTYCKQEKDIPEIEQKCNLLLGKRYRELALLICEAHCTHHVTQLRRRHEATLHAHIIIIAVLSDWPRALVQ